MSCARNDSRSALSKDSAIPRAGGQGGRDYYAEMNAWSYTWHVQHDVAGLINLMGGRGSFVARLDRLFTEQYRGSPPSGGPGGTKYHFQAWFPDMTGLIGQYSHGNEQGRSSCTWARIPTPRGEARRRQRHRPCHPSSHPARIE